jgi:hypothetical protein
MQPKFVWQNGFDRSKAERLYDLGRYHRHMVSLASARRDGCLRRRSDRRLLNKAQDPEAWEIRRLGMTKKSLRWRTRIYLAGLSKQMPSLLSLSFCGLKMVNTREVCRCRALGQILFQIKRDGSMSPLLSSPQSVRRNIHSPLSRSLARIYLAPVVGWVQTCTPQKSLPKRSR